MKTVPCYGDSGIVASIAGDPPAPWPVLLPALALAIVTSKSVAPAFSPAGFILPFLFLGVTEILSPRSPAKDDNRQKGEGAAAHTNTIVTEMETGPQTVSGVSLCPRGGGSSRAGARQ